MAKLTFEDDMKKILGAKIGIYLKNADNTFANLSGVLVHTDEKHIYIQKTSDKTLVIPRENVLYYESDRVPLDEDDSIVINNVGSKPQFLPSQNTLQIFVNDQLVSSLSCAPEFNLSAWHNGIMEVVLNDANAQAALSNMNQEKIEFESGEGGANVYITASYIPEQPSSGNTFAMTGSGSNIATSYVKPSEMVTRLNKVAKGVKKDG